MAIQPNRFNDPALGAAFANIASLFGPPSAQDLVGYTTAKAKKDEAERLSWLFANPNDPLADRKATMAGVYAPTQSYYAVDQGNDVARRGQDVTAQTTLQTNAADNARMLAANNENNRFGLAGQYMTPLAEGAVQPGLPADVASMFGVPALPRAEGNRAPLSETQQLAADSQRLQENGTLTDTMLLDRILGADAPVKVIGEGGDARFMSPGQAARTGAPAFTQEGSPPAPELQNYRTPDGRSGTARFDTEAGQWVDTQTGTPLPDGSMTLKSTATGTADDALGTKSNVTLGQKQIALADLADARAQSYEQFLAANPGVAGVPGALKGFAQDIRAGVEEMVATYGDADLPVEAFTSLADRVAGGGNYDPAVREALTRASELAYLQAQIGDPGGEVNVREWERLYSLYIGNIGGNAAVAGPLRALRDQAAARRGYGQNLIDGNNTPYPGAAPGAAPAPAAGAPADNIPTVNTPEEAAALPSGTKFRTPDGRVKVVP